MVVVVLILGAAALTESTISLSTPGADIDTMINGVAFLGLATFGKERRGRSETEQPQADDRTAGSEDRDERERPRNDERERPRNDERDDLTRGKPEEAALSPGTEAVGIDEEIPDHGCDVRQAASVPRPCNEVEHRHL